MFLFSQSLESDPFSWYKVGSSLRYFFWFWLIVMDFVKSEAADLRQEKVACPELGLSCCPHEDFKYLKVLLTSMIDGL